jgi:hypothetical protein
MTTHHTGPAASTGAADAPLRSSTRPPKLERDLFIGNQWRPSSTGHTIGLVNPATEQPFGRAVTAPARVTWHTTGAALAAEPEHHGPFGPILCPRAEVYRPGRTRRNGYGPLQPTDLRKDLSRGSRRCRHHAGRRRWPAMLMGSTRMKCSGSPSTHDWRPTLPIDARSASVST